MTEFTLEMVRAARETIKGTALHTPLVPSPRHGMLAGRDFLLKLEMTQPMGAFKLRGAANAIFNLTGEVKGVTCCSTGNHGRAVTYAANKRQIPATICMSELVPQAKIDGIEALGGTCRITGRSQDDAQQEALRLVREERLVEISPFDDPYVIAGQGTIALEMLEDCPDLAMVLVPLSGGGLAGGVAFALKQMKPRIKVIGLSMDRGAAMQASLAAGHPVEVEEVASLADSLGGGIGLENRLSFPLCRDYLDDVILVTEEEIYHAMRSLYFEDRIVCEGASSVGVAALLAGKLPPVNGPVATIITGRNLDMAIHAEIMQGRIVQLGDLRVGGL
ncbi:hydroxyectoine utilization dehydratase EutB [Aestuariispira insulae]|uniref:Threonine dehydratase n=1 Tax=Aestuariispira insulae TaxID=1461337 RepID=A0A3D9H2M7_9PROT|nr:hydroxyectoine utilization dehydratase EutB [Aestuariispira insulae]RED43768.1 threonine dehydratase [Aestuariispira insulae]